MSGERPIYRPSFSELIMRFDIRISQWGELERRAGITRFVMNALFLGTPVYRHDARAALAILSEITGRECHLDNTRVPLIEVVLCPVPGPPLTFGALWHSQLFDIEEVGYSAGIPPQVIRLMFLGQPVARVQAEKVLSTLSKVMGQELTLEMVNVTTL